VHVRRERPLLTGTLTPAGTGSSRASLRAALRRRSAGAVRAGRSRFQIERHSPWIPKENVRWSYAWIKGAAGPASTQQVGKFTKAALEQMKKSGVAGTKLGVDFIDINMIQAFKDAKIDWVDGMSPMMEARAVKNVDEQECLRIVGASATPRTGRR
jgi:Xaa-Pro aminopeptidase